MTETPLDKICKAYKEEHEDRMNAEQAADWLYEALTEATCEDDCKRAIKEAEKKWPWLG